MEKELESAKNDNKKLRETINQLNKENDELTTKVNALQIKANDKVIHILTTVSFGIESIRDT